MWGPLASSGYPAIAIYIQWVLIIDNGKTPWTLSHDILPYITSFVNNGAKAVKRFRQAEFTEVANNTFIELLGIAVLYETIYAHRREGDEPYG